MPSLSPSLPETAHRSLDLVFIGLTLSSSWGNGHATTYRGLLHALHRRGHRIRFLERDVPWYASERDLRKPDFCQLDLYQDLEDLRNRFTDTIAASDAVIIGSYVPDADAVIRWASASAGGALAFYDIDTPITIEALRRGNCEYLQGEQVPLFDLYLSFSGGRTLEELEHRFGARRARHLPCAVDIDHYYPVPMVKRFELGYLGTFSEDRQPGLESLLLAPARHLPERAFAVAGPAYPTDIVWPPNVARFEHLPPQDHPEFYAQQKFTLNITRTSMKRLGHSPSVRLFEAASCATAVISDVWAGIEDYFTPDSEILLCESTEAVLECLRRTPSDVVDEIGAAARQRVLRQHTPQHRAIDLENMLAEAGVASSSSRGGKGETPRTSPSIA